MLLNRERANLVMDRHGLDGLVAAFPENVYYLSDYWGPMFLMSRNYTLYALLPRDENASAALVMPGTGVYHLEHRPTWMPNVATFVTRVAPRTPRDFEFTTEELDLDQMVTTVSPDTPLTPYPTRPGAEMAPRDLQLLDRYAAHQGRSEATAARALGRAIHDAGLGTGRLGFDDPRVLGWLREIGHTALDGVDALNVFKEIRMVKSPAEIELLRIAGRRGEEVLDGVIERMEVGMPLDALGDIHARLAAERECRSEWIIANIRGLATGAVEAGELIKLDSVVSYRQYRGDVGRSVYFGEPDAEMLRRSEAVSRALEIAYAEIRPGRTFKEIVDLTLAAVHREGFPSFVIAGPHSVGLEHTDHPVSVGAEMPGHHPLAFEENMVFTLDMPYHEFGWGTTHVEDMMIVRKDGCEPITSMDTRLRVKPA
ncbi:MAG TPA: M24 family metallopeptidase [Novosphingobium sp.]|nr:M24 family metallopeptidase [Novosphingobium sp.]